MENQEQIQQFLPEITLQLNLAQVNAVIDALGKMPTESNVWPLRQFINNQTVVQLEQLQQSSNQPIAEEPATVQ